MSSATMSLKDTLKNDLITSMKARDANRVAVIRFINSAIKQREVDERIELTDTDILAILDKQSKQRRESIVQFQQAERLDLAEKEQQELEIIQSFLPQALTDAELTQLITDAIKTSGASNIKDMAKAMAILKPQVQGRADMKAVSDKIKSLLS